MFSPIMHKKKAVGNAWTVGQRRRKKTATYRRAIEGACRGKVAAGSGAPQPRHNSTSSGGSIPGSQGRRRGITPVGRMESATASGMLVLRKHGKQEEEMKVPD